MNFHKIILFLFLAILPLSAQRTEKILIRFAAQTLPPEMPEISMVAGEVASPPFEVSTEWLTKPQVSPGRIFSLRSLGAEKNFANVKLPAEGSRFIVLLVLAEEGKVGSIVIPDDRKGFGSGDVYAFNASKLPVLGQLGTTKFGLTPAKGKIVRPAGVVDDQYFEVRFATQVDGTSRLFGSTRWPDGKEERCYLFFYTNADTPDRVRYRVISEVLHPLTEED